MKTFTVNRLFKRMASVRDYLVDDCIKNKEGFIIECEGKKMTIPFEKLDKIKFQIQKTKFPSKYNPDQSYELYDFVFTPDDEIKPIKVEKKKSEQLTLC